MRILHDTLDVLLTFPSRSTLLWRDPFTLTQNYIISLLNIFVCTGIVSKCSINV